MQVLTSHASALSKRFSLALGVPLSVVQMAAAKDYLAFVETVDLGLCVSLSESFSYNCAELMLTGVPTLFGPTINWAWRSTPLAEICGIRDPGNIEEIVTKMTHLLGDDETYTVASTLATKVAREIFESHHVIAREVIGRLTG
jgi:hypothetical protein